MFKKVLKFKVDSFECNIILKAMLEFRKIHQEVCGESEAIDNIMIRLFDEAEAKGLTIL